ncbi:MAG: hypothetical protein EBW52_03150 [Betaproteobacteria bacterium]|nr:hypothetical protein [Betaproteobacteria bacterium]
MEPYRYIIEDAPRFIAYVRAVCARYNALAPLAQLFDAFERLFHLRGGHYRLIGTDGNQRTVCVGLAPLELEAALGRKTLENEILKEAVEYGKSRKWIAHSPLLPGDEQ